MKVRNSGYGNRTCLDAQGGKKGLRKPVSLYPCHRQGGNQVINDNSSCCRLVAKIIRAFVSSLENCQLFFRPVHILLRLLLRGFQLFYFVIVAQVWVRYQDNTDLDFWFILKTILFWLRLSYTIGRHFFDFNSDFNDIWKHSHSCL